MSAPDTKFVLGLAREIETAKSNLAKLQAQWDALFAPSEQAATKHTGRRPKPDGIASKVLKAINSDQTILWNAERVTAFTRIPRKRVDKALFNLYSAGKIQRVSRGNYRSGQAPASPIQASLQEAVVN